MLPKLTVMKLLVFLMLSAVPLAAAEITVFAAASLTEALKEIAAEYGKTSADKVRFNFAASNVLAQQIQAGAPADIFFSADEPKMDALQAAKLVETDTRRNLLGNSLVVVIPDDAPPLADAAALTTIKRLSLADPRAVPAGIYAKTWLEKSGLWAAVEKKIIPAENVRAAMAVVEAGNADAGIVYKTDAAISRKLKIAFEITDGPPITYPAAVLSDSRQPQAARKFLAYLAEKPADEIFRKFGFSVID